MPKLSIISPVYNSGPYLDKFFKSIQQQTFKDFEIVFVYDKSSDNSLELLNTFKESFPKKDNIKIIVNDEKKGAGYARELGVKSLSNDSKYILFLDSDDGYKENFFEKMVNKIEETDADFVCCGFSRINEQTNAVVCEEMINNPNGILNIKDNKFPLFLINSSTWNKIFKREIVEKTSFGLAPRAEDLYFLINYILNSKTVSFINEILYLYYIHDGSQVNTTSYDKYEQTFEAFKHFSDLKDKNIDFNLVSAFVFLRLGIGMTIRTSMQDKKTKKKTLKNSKSYLKTNFRVFSKNKLLSFSFLTKSGRKGLAIWICKILYKLNMFSIVVNRYASMIRKGKKEIHW